MPRPIASCGKGRWGASVLPAEWRERLLSVPEPARFAAARLIYWEFFSMRLIPQRWDHIDDLIERREEVDDETLVKALILVGAPRSWAERRIIVKPRARRKVGGKWT